MAEQVAPDSARTGFSPDSTFEETHCYYFGIGGDPKFLSRSNHKTQPFNAPYHASGRPIPKIIDHVGRHPITSKYDQHLRGPILAAVQGANLGWVAIDVVRMGFDSTTPRHPVVVLIRVRKGVVGQNLDVVNDIYQLLQSHDLADVNVEIMAIDDIPELAIEDVPGVVRAPYDRYPKIGQSISSWKTSEGAFNRSSGTLGLYITAGGQRYGLTCHHVPFSGGLNVPREPQNLPDNQRNLSPYVGQPDECFRVMYPSNEDHKSTKKHYRGIIQDSESEIESLNRNIQELSFRGDDERARKRIAALQAERQVNQDAKRNSETILRELERLDNVNSNDLEKPLNESCVLGTVYRSSGQVKDPVTSGTMDWALLKISPARQANAINELPDFKQNESWVDAVNEGLALEHRLRPRMLPEILENVGELTSITNPVATDENGDPCLRVLKYGGTTHWTAGQSNCILSNCHRRNGAVTKEWCIIDKGLGRKSFSKGGDSGAMIFDFNGHILGMITSGGQSRGMDTGPMMTYATPIAWLFDDIEAKIGSFSLEPN